MGKSRRNKQIPEIYDDLLAHLDAEKFIVSDFVVSETKQNHHESYSASELVNCYVSFGETRAECEIRQFSIYNYSFSYFSNSVDGRIITRLDTGDGTHNNKAPGIPLELTSVPTPHIHRYRKDGYLIAYPIKGIDYSSESSLKFDCYQGYSYFCSELSIKSLNGAAPNFIFAPKGRIHMEYEQTDPNAGIIFPLTDE